MRLNLSRRGLVLGSIGTVALSGCLSGGGGDSGTTIEYSISDPKTHDEIPEQAFERAHPNRENYRWIVVEIEVSGGSFEGGDIIGMTAIETDERGEIPRAVEYDGDIITDPDAEFTLEDGDSASIYYQVLENAEPEGWNTEQLEVNHDVEPERA